MNFAKRQSLKIFFTSILILMIAIVVFYKLNFNSVLNHQLEDSKFIAEKISTGIDQHLIEKVKKAKTIAAAPVITNALFKSNKYYQSLSKKRRDEEILQKNNKWKTIEDQNNSFILDYTNNEVSKYLKILQHNIKGEYGEIFLTNKYGALVASTAKLTTFAHGHKYWWQDAYNDGNGAVFLDDRGYDDSVDGYVLGVVVPIKKDNEIIGILKANLNILGSINSIIVNSQMKSHEKLKLIRSGGLIVFEEGIEPLSKRISDNLLKKIQAKPNESFVFETEGDKFVVGCAEIKISSEMEGYNFGGDFESIDHKKGNSGESWLILDLNPFSNVISQTTGIVSGLWFIGILLTIVFAITSFIIGKRTAKPLNELIIQTKRITKGDYNFDIVTNRKDEIGELAISFNQMTNYLKESTTSIDKLSAEIRDRKQAEDRLKLISQITTDLIYEWDVQTDTLEWFGDIDGFLGYKQDEIHRTIEGWIKLIHPDDLKKLSNSVELHRTSTEPIDVDYRVQKKDGTWVFLSDKGTPILNSKGKPVKWIGGCDDISERKRADEIIKTERDKLQLLMDGLSQTKIGVDVIGIDYKIISQNKLLIDRFGDIAGKICYEEYMGFDKPCSFCPMIKAIKNNTVERVELKASDGRDYEIISASLLDSDGTIDKAIEVVNDITERKHTEEEINKKSKELEKHFQKSEKQRIATLSVLSDLNETTKNLKLEVSERKLSEQIQKVLYNISNAVVTTDNLEKLIKRIREELSIIIDTTNFYIALYDNKTDTISLPFFKDEKDAVPSFPAGKTLTYYVIRTEKSLLATKEELTILEKNGDIESFGSDSKVWLGVPFKIEGKVSGVLAVQSYTDENAYSKSDKEILEFVSRQISISIERKKLRRI